METFGAEIRQACRMMRRSPGFTATAVTALALGIGASTAIFSVVNAVLLKPLPFPQPERIVQLMGTSPGGKFEMTNVPRFNAWREQTRILEHVTAYDWNGAGINLTGRDRPEQLKGKRVSREYFQVFGALVVLGRTFTTDEDRPGSGHFVVISNGLWQRRFQSDPNIVGKAISLGGEPHTVVGVLGAAFAPDPPADIWLPLQADPNSIDESTYFLWAAARLKPGVTLEQANAGLKLAAAEYRRSFPKALVPANSFTAVPLRDAVTGDVRPALLVLLVAVTCVLLIACANVANLLLVRAAGRTREIAIRSAVGARRSRIIRQLLTESLMLSLIGGGLGLIVGTVGIRALLALNPGNIPRIGPDGMTITLDWRVLGFTLLASLVTGILFGSVPAVHAARTDLNSALKEGGSRSGGGRQNRTRSVMVIAEMALAIVLLIGAGLLIRTFTALRTVAPGIDAHNVLTMQTSLAGPRFNQTAAIAGTVRQCEEHLGAIPGVQAVAAADSLPLEFGLGMAIII
jgi:putative ABC transport system permease protein